MQSRRRPLLRRPRPRWPITRRIIITTITITIIITIITECIITECIITRRPSRLKRPSRNKSGAALLAPLETARGALRAGSSGEHFLVSDF
jgi:hypothetical protein